MSTDTPDAAAANEPSEKLSWSFNPWQADWRRPVLALVLCLAVAILGGWAFTVPPKHPQPSAADSSAGTQVQVVEDSQGSEGAEDNVQRPGQAFKEARENLPWQIHWFWWSLAGLLLLLGMTAPVYFTARYQLDSEGITVLFMGKRTFRKWSEYRNYYPHPKGAHVTTLSTPSRLDPFRGHYLQFAAPDAEGKNNRAEVLDLLERHMTLKGVPESDVPRS